LFSCWTVQVVSTSASDLTRKTRLGRRERKCVDREELSELNLLTHLPLCSEVKINSHVSTVNGNEMITKTSTFLMKGTVP